MSAKRSMPKVLIRDLSSVRPEHDITRGKIGRPGREYSPDKVLRASPCGIRAAPDCNEVIAQESGMAAVTIRAREASRHNSLATASGRLLLALLPPVEAGRQVMLARALFKGSTVTDIELRRAWKQIARARCSTARNESLAGLADTAVPVRGTGAWTHAALASSHFLAAKDSSRLAHALDELRAAATAIANNSSG